MKANNKAVMVPYEPKPREKAAVEAWRERRRLRRPSPKLKVTAQEGENATIELDHPDLQTGSILLMDAIGTVSDEFVAPFISRGVPSDARIIPTGPEWQQSILERGELALSQDQALLGDLRFERL